MRRIKINLLYLDAAFFIYWSIFLKSYKKLGCFRWIHYITSSVSGKSGEPETKRKQFFLPRFIKKSFSIHLPKSLQLRKSIVDKYLGPKLVFLVVIRSFSNMYGKFHRNVLSTNRLHCCPYWRIFRFSFFGSKL